MRVAVRVLRLSCKQEEPMPLSLNEIRERARVCQELGRETSRRAEAQKLLEQRIFQRCLAMKRRGVADLQA